MQILYFPTVTFKMFSLNNKTLIHVGLKTKEITSVTLMEVPMVGPNNG